MTHELTLRSVPEITCREVAEWTSAYLEAHLNEPDQVRMAVHLASCAGCGAYVAQIETVRRVLRRLPGAQPEPGGLDRLSRAFAARRRGSTQE